MSVGLETITLLAYRRGFALLPVGSLYLLVKDYGSTISFGRPCVLQMLGRSAAGVREHNAEAPLSLLPRATWHPSFDA
jgi:hypothetical protein